ncbi:MAG: hypothetical protein ACREYB_05240 [Casimicrobiaceae bacterium]
MARATGRLTLPELLEFLDTVRASTDRQMTPLLFNASGATTDMTGEDVERVVAAVRASAARSGVRGHVAIIADDDRLYDGMLLYETRCAEIGVRVIRVFRQSADAERWLEAVAAARHFT